MSSKPNPWQWLSRQLGDFAKLQWRLWQRHLQTAVPILGLVIGGSAGLAMRQVETELTPFVTAAMQTGAPAPGLTAIGINASRAPP